MEIPQIWLGRQEYDGTWLRRASSIKIDNNIRIMLFGSLIRCSLLRSLHIILAANNIAKLQSFYSTCIRTIIDWDYYETNENRKSRTPGTYNIDTAEAKLMYSRLNMYYRLKNALSIAYLDGDFIMSELKTLGDYILNLKDTLRNNRPNGNKMK